MESSEANTERTEPSPRDAYDRVPYDGGALAPSHPDVLRLAAARRGLIAPGAAKARVLELGCADGANLLPIAFRLPDTRCVGLDASRRQLDAALEGRDRLGIENLEFVHQRIEDVDPEELGTFDYVICHGVLSWVVPAVQARLWTLVKEVLAPDGVALISFNCTPGWRVRDEIRHAVLRRVEGLPEEEHIGAARALLEVLQHSPAADTPYSALLAEEARRVLLRSDAYLAHEYLEDHLQSFRYGEIAHAAAEVGLGPLEELGPAHPDRQTEDALRDALRRSEPDVVRAEELAETMLFRAFRLMTFVHEDRLSEKSPVPRRTEVATELHWAGRLRPEEKRVSLDPGVTETFLSGNGERVASADPLLKGALLEIARAWPATVSWEALVARLTALLEIRRVPESYRAPDRLEALGADLLSLRRFGSLTARSLSCSVVGSSERPRVSALTRWEAERGAKVTGPFHHTVAVDSLARGLIRHLDGARDGAALLKEANGLVERGEVILRDAEGEVLGEAATAEALPALVQNAIAGLAEAGLLER